MNYNIALHIGSSFNGVTTSKHVTTSTNSETQAINGTLAASTSDSKSQNQQEPFVVYNYMESLPSFTNLKLDPRDHNSLEDVLPKLCLQNQNNKMAVEPEKEEVRTSASDRPDSSISLPIIDPSPKKASEQCQKSER